MNTYDFGYVYIDGVVERVNGGPVQGFDHHTSEFLAASYAYDAAKQSGFMDSDAISTHLDILSDEGAEFDHEKALEIATGTLVEVNGRWVSRDAAVNLMDDELRESLLSAQEWDSEQEFMDAYAAAHEKKFNEEFTVS